MKRADLFVGSANGNILPKAVSGQSMGNQNGSESKDGDFFLGRMYDSVRRAQLAAQDIQHDEKDTLRQGERTFYSFDPYAREDFNHCKWTYIPLEGD